MKGIITAMMLLLLTSVTVSYQDDHLVFVVIDQSHHSQWKHVKELTNSINKEAELQDKFKVDIHVTSEQFPGVSSWIYFPILESLTKYYTTHNKGWFVFITEQTNINLTAIIKFLSKRNPREDFYYGRGILDDDSSIIHHYDSVNLTLPLLYPDERTGFILSSALLERMTQLWQTNEHLPEIDFTIDAIYEFNKFLRSKLNVTLNSADTLFCPHHYNDDTTDRGKHCGITPSVEDKCIPAEISDVEFAVKTCSKFHSERLPVLHSTWLPEALRHTLYSDVSDETYGTVSVDVANTDRGHCSKTMEIIGKASKQSHVKWLVIVDDDTLLSVPRLMEYLGCFDPTELIAIGQRYGYRLLQRYGYEYPTGGAGIILSKQLINQLSTPGMCDCPTDDTPDDMYLGLCLTRMKVPIVHSSRLHQARPDDYPIDLLRGSRPISFHKFWMINPIEVYKTWLLESTDYINHSEL